VACVNELAARGQNGGMCTMAAKEYSKSFCQLGGAAIWGTKSHHTVVQSANW
jgi:hypothetical protein